MIHSEPPSGRGSALIPGQDGASSPLRRMHRTRSAATTDGGGGFTTSSSQTTGSFRRGPQQQKSTSSLDATTAGRKADTNKHPQRSPSKKKQPPPPPPSTKKVLVPNRNGVIAQGSPPSWSPRQASAQENPKKPRNKKNKRSTGTDTLQSGGQLNVEPATTVENPYIGVPSQNKNKRPGRKPRLGAKKGSKQRTDMLQSKPERGPGVVRANSSGVIFTSPTTVIRRNHPPPPGRQDSSRSTQSTPRTRVGVCTGVIRPRPQTSQRSPRSLDDNLGFTASMHANHETTRRRKQTKSCSPPRNNTNNPHKLLEATTGLATTDVTRPKQCRRAIPSSSPEVHPGRRKSRVPKNQSKTNVVGQDNAACTAAATTTATPSPTNPDPIDCPKHGIRLSYIIREFIPSCGSGGQHDGGDDDASSPLKGLTTAYVCEHYIKPKTQDEQSSYCDMLKRQGRHDAVGEVAEVFISHAHLFEFLAVIDALRWHFRDIPDIIIWFDLFSINQHQPHDWSFEWLSTTFQSSIETFQRTVMVLSPWNNPIPFTRAWCIFEVYCTALANNKFEIALSRDDRDQFLKDVEEDPEYTIDKMLATIQAEKSECSEEEDLKRIFSVVESTVGFAKINAMVFERYRDWVVKVSSDALESCGAEASAERCTLLKVVGMLYLGQGNHSEAESYLRQCHEESKAVFGEFDPKTLTSMNNLANAYLDRGEYAKAIDILKKCHKNSLSTLGRDHRVTLDAMNYLGVGYHSEGEYSRALPWCRDGLERRRTVLGENHPDTLTSMNGLASLYEDQGAYQKAFLLYEDCLEKRIAELGENHPNTLTSRNNLALFYKKRGHFEKALPHYETCLSRRMALLGPSHPETLNSMNNLASLLFTRGDYDKAQSLYEECLEKQRDRLGESHPSTLTSINNLAIFHENQRRYDKSLSLYKECLDKQLTTLGSKNPDTLVSMNNLASFYSKRNQHKKALPLYKKCLARRREVLGSDHPETLDSIHNLAVQYDKQGDVELAAPLHEECLAKREAVLGKSHRDTLASKESLALSHHSRDDPEKAISLAIECQEEITSKYGKDDRKTLAVNNRLSVILSERGGGVEQRLPDERPRDRGFGIEQQRTDEAAQSRHCVIS